MEREALKLALEALKWSKPREGAEITHSEAITAIESALAQPAQEPTYTSTQATTCAGCLKHKHTPLRIDAMGGYVCLTCIDQKLGSLLGEFGYTQPAQEQWNAALDHAAERIGEIKAFGQATQDSFAVYIKGLKR